jgi:parvulin-like peptidyl-prolyl isomerase
MRRTCGIVAVLAAGAALAGQTSAQAPAAAPKPAAVVNGTSISLAEVDAILKAQGPPPGESTDAKRRQAQMFIVGNLIDDALIQQFLTKNGYKADAADVNKQVSELEDGLKKNGKSLADFCKDTGQSEARLRINAATFIQKSAYIKAHLTDADVKKFYDETRDFFDGNQVRVSHIMVKVAPNATDAERKDLHDRLLALRQQILDAKIAFADAAKKYSHSESASSGGDIGFFQRKGDVEESFARAAFKLDVGQISDVVATEFGLHLIKMTEKKPGKPTKFEDVKERAYDCCIFEMWEAILVQQRKAAKIEINLP